MDLATIKADLKAWERRFKAEHGTEPSKADIRAVPEIAEKYKIYSKSRTTDKPAPAAAVTAARPPPVTPTKASRSSSSKHASAAVDIFKTPGRDSAARQHSNGTKASGAATGSVAPAATATQFAFAPSPSRLRALAASRSFSGSPNKKTSKLAYEEDASGHASHRSEVQSIGPERSFILPPVADTPRTKARKWLAGDDAVSPPVKGKRAIGVSGFASTSASQPLKQAVKPTALQTEKPKKKSSFWAQVERAKKADQEEDDLEDAMAVDAQGDAESMADVSEVMDPSPVKGYSGGNTQANGNGNGYVKGKGKQRQLIDLFTEAYGNDEVAEDEDQVEDDGLPRQSQRAAPTVVIVKKKVAASSFFSAPASTSTASSAATTKSKPFQSTTTPSLSPFASRPSSSSSVSTKATAHPRPAPKKRSSTAAALAPFDRFNDGEEASSSGTLGVPSRVKSREPSPTVAMNPVKESEANNFKKDTSLPSQQPPKRPRTHDTDPASDLPAPLASARGESTSGPSRPPRHTRSPMKSSGRMPESFTTEIEDEDGKRVQLQINDYNPFNAGAALASPRKAKAPGGVIKSKGRAVDLDGDGMRESTEGSTGPEVDVGDTEAEDDEAEAYELRDFSDEYEEYREDESRFITSTTNGTNTQRPFHSSRSRSSTPLPQSLDNPDSSLDPELVSLLSLRTSPVKNRLAKLHKKRDETVNALLQEPTYLLAKKKELERKGLEDLEEDEDVQRSKGEDGDDTNEYNQDFGVEGARHVGEDEEQARERSDDDWASEPEGWKDLGDGEMDEMDL